jgi:hypothetical protein
MAGPYDFTGQNIENTYQRVLQTPDGTTFYDGTGSLVILPSANTSSLLTTASVNLNTITFTKGDGTTFPITVNTGSGGSGTPTFPYTGSAIISGSLTITGSLNAPSITGSLFGTASYALNGGVTQILAGSNISLSPTNGLGQVTIISTGGGGNTATGSYGSFYSTVTQTNVASTARSMSLNVTDISNGVSISGSTNPYNTYIKTENPGIYDIQFSAQVDKTDSGTDEIWIWLRKNGVNVDDSATSVQLVGNGAHYVAAWNFFVNSSANDYYQLMWYSPDANVRLHAEPAFGVVPGIPSLIVTANRVDQFLSNTGSFTGSFTGNLIGTASYVTGSVFTSANPALSASYALTASYALNGGTTFPFTGSAIISGSLIVTGSIRSTLGFTGSLFGTASQATTASLALNAVSSSTSLISNQIRVTNPEGGVGNEGYISFTQANPGAGLTSPESLYLTNTLRYNFISNILALSKGLLGAPAPTFNLGEASTGGFINLSGSLNIYNSGSAALTISGSTGPLIQVNDIISPNIFTVQSASVAILNVNTGSVVTISGSLNVTSGITGSLLGTASYAITASYALNGGGGGGTPAGNDFEIQYNDHGVFGASPRLTFDNINNNLVLTGSFLISSSNTFTNIGPSIFSGSVNISGSLLVNNVPVLLSTNFNNFTSSYNTGSFTGSFTGLLTGTSSYASQSLSSSYALSASYAVSTGETGIATLDYGSTPGTNIATVVINTPNVNNNSSINIYIMNTSSINHNTADHQVFSLYSRVMPGNIINNTSFDITCISDLRINGQFKVKYNIIN